MGKFALASAVLLALPSTGALAASIPSNPGDRASQSLVEPVASWRYNNNCSWQGGRWAVDLGGGKLVVCRPNRPGRDYSWRREGQRNGWYHRNERRWHHNNW